MMVVMATIMVSMVSVSAQNPTAALIVQKTLTGDADIPVYAPNKKIVVSLSIFNVGDGYTIHTYTATLIVSSMSRYRNDV